MPISTSPIAITAFCLRLAPTVGPMEAKLNSWNDDHLAFAAARSCWWTGSLTELNRARKALLVGSNVTATPVVCKSFAKKFCTSASVGWPTGTLNSHIDPPRNSALCLNPYVAIAPIATISTMPDSVNQIFFRPTMLSMFLCSGGSVFHKSTEEKLCGGDGAEQAHHNADQKRECKSLHKAGGKVV